MMGKRFKIKVHDSYDYDYIEKELVTLEEWLESLTEAEIQELGSIDFGYHYNQKEAAVKQSITQDWIEEHGGEREWWRLFETLIVEKKE